MLRAGRLRLPGCRAFTLGDGMILTASVGLTFGALRATAPGFLERLREKSTVNSPLHQVLLGIFWCLPIALSIFSFAFLAIRFRSPNPGRISLGRQPGTIACGAAAIASTIVFSCKIISEISSEWDLDGIWTLPYSLSPYCAPVILGAWFALAFGGRWRREPGWIDRLGLTIGQSWLLLDLLWISWMIFSW
jgi:hypothetical protein